LLRPTVLPFSEIQPAPVSRPSLPWLGTAADRWLLLLLLLLLAGGSRLLYGELGQGPAMVDIYVGKRPFASYPLGESRRVAVPGEAGETIIDIADNHVQFLSSPCRGQQCVHAGARHAAGEMLVCVPGRIMVTIRGSEARRIDAVAE